jgi:hypothetical protein
MVLNRISEHFTNLKKKNLEKDSIDFEFSNDNKKFILKLHESTGYEPNSHKLDIREISQAEGIIFIYSKYSYESLKYINDFMKCYHMTIGNKFFPCVFIQNESVYSDTNYSTSVTKKEIDDITKNGCFPLIKVKNDFDKRECNKMFNSVLNEIKKEKNDDFPYSLAYQEELNINFCIKNHKVFSILNIVSFLFVMLFTFLDTLFIINTQDFSNETKKVDDFFLGIRLNMNAINFISALIFCKYALFDREKFNKIIRLEKYVIIVNLISWIIQLLLHLRIKHVSQFC